MATPILVTGAAGGFKVLHAESFYIDAAMEIGDADTADVFTDVSRGMDKHLWFLEAHLQGQGPDSGMSAPRPAGGDRTAPGRPRP